MDRAGIEPAVRLPDHSEQPLDALSLSGSHRSRQGLYPQ